MTWMFFCLQRFERHRIDRAPAGAVGDAGKACDPAGLLRRDHVGDGVLVIVEIGLDDFFATSMEATLPPVDSDFHSIRPG